MKKSILDHQIDDDTCHFFFYIYFLVKVVDGNSWKKKNKSHNVVVPFFGVTKKEKKKKNLFFSLALLQLNTPVQSSPLNDLSQTYPNTWPSEPTKLTYRIYFNLTWPWEDDDFFIFFYFGFIKRITPSKINRCFFFLLEFEK